MMIKIIPFFEAIFLCGLIYADDKDSKTEYLLNSFFDVENGSFYKSELVNHNKKDKVEDTKTSLFISDEILTEEQLQDFEPLRTKHLDAKNQKRKVIAHKKALWPNAIVPYKFSNKRRFTGHRAPMAVRQAIRHWERYTCLRFVETNSPAYHRDEVTKEGFLEIGTGSGCASTVGFLRRGPQNMYLNEGTCLKLGTIAHELGHVIGFYHEQARSDRNDYVRIIVNHIKRGYLSNFAKAKKTLNKAPYDLASDMHYGPMFFSERGYDTIVSKDPFLQFLMGRRYGLSFYDIEEANSAYNCAGSCNGFPRCQNGGFLLKGCTCYCPDGLAGPTCEQISRSKSKGNGFLYFLTYGSGKQIASLFPHTHAIWLFKSPENTTMELELILDLSRDEKTHTCRHWVEIRYNLVGQEGPRFCGLSTEIYPLIKTVSNILMIKFNAEIADPLMNKNQGMSINIHVLGRIDRHVKCTFSDADMEYCPFFQLSPTKVDFKRMVIPLSWLKTNQIVLEEKRRAYLYVDSLDNSTATAACTSAQLQAGTWCIKFAYWIYGHTTSSIHLKAILENSADAHATHKHSETYYSDTEQINPHRPAYRRHVDTEYGSERTITWPSRVEAEKTINRRKRLKHVKNRIEKEKSLNLFKNLDTLIQLQDSNELGVNHPQPLPGFKDHLTAKLFKLSKKVGQQKDTTDGIRKRLLQRTENNLKKTVNVRDNKKHFKNVYIGQEEVKREGTRVKTPHTQKKTVPSSADTTVDESLLWQTSQPARSWKEIQVTYRSSRIFQIVFDSVVSSGDTIMIDEFELSPEVCPMPDKTVNMDGSSAFEGFFCDFEKDMCGFINDRNVNSMSWVRMQTFQMFGPFVDHTLGKNSRGWFLSRDRLQTSPGTKASIVSKEFHLHTETGCVEFWFYAWGFSFGKLSLYQYYIGREYRQLWTLSINWLHQGHWEKKRVLLQTARSFQLVFYTELDNWWGVFAIDDISVKSGPC